MRYIICYRLRRKNARRKELFRMDFDNDKEAIDFFIALAKFVTKDEITNY